MKLVLENARDLQVKRFVLVFSGDGREEQRILKNLAERFDGEKQILFWPKDHTT
jgi:hypothetical protein